MPGEAEKAAAYLGMAFAEFKAKYLVTDYWVSNDGDIDVLAPLKIIPNDDARLPGADFSVRRLIKGLVERARAKPGGRAPSNYPYYAGRCVFLDENNRCKIHAVKPYECRMSICEGPVVKWREKVAAAWAKLLEVS
jgi:hypothetical protein